MKKYKSNIISLILAIVLLIFIWHNFLISGNNIIFVFIFASAYITIKRTIANKSFFDKNKMINIGVIALLFSMIEIICKNIGTGNPTNNIINKWLIVNFMGYFIISGIIIFWLYHIFENLRFQFGNRELFKEDRYKWLKNEKIITVMNIIVIFVAWIPFFLRFYPGIVTSDSYSQIEQTIGLIGLSDHHPITHTAIIGIFINIGLKLTNNINIGIALYSIFSMIAMATMDALVLKYLRKKKVPSMIRLMVLLFYALYPINAIYSITMWKDVLFSGMMSIFIIQNIELVTNTDEFLQKKINIALYILVSILTILLRHNGLYVVMITLIATFIPLRKYWKKLLMMLIIIVIVYESHKIIIFNVLKAEKSSVAEMLSVPIQQIARTVKYNIDDINEETIEEINKYFIIENVWENYDPTLSDPVKFKFNTQYFNDNKLEFIKIWIELFTKYPKDYIIATISNSYGYYYPEAKNTMASWVTLDHNNMGIKQTPVIKGEEVEEILVTAESRDIPVISLIFSIGAGVWLTIIALGYKMYKKEYKYILVYLPIIVLWLTLLASPAYCEYRYAYPIFLALPIYISMNFINRKEEKDGENSSINTLLQ